MSLARSGSQSSPQMTLITFHPAPRKWPSSSWMILPLPRTGPSSRCRLQLTTKMRLSSFLAAGQRDRAEGLGLVGLAVAEEGPDLVVGLGVQTAVLEVVVEARLVDGHDRAETHRHRRELPEIRHQPRVGVGRQAAAGPSRSSRRKLKSCPRCSRPSRYARA